MKSSRQSNGENRVIVSKEVAEKLDDPFDFWVEQRFQRGGKSIILNPALAAEGALYRQAVSFSAP